MNLFVKFTLCKPHLPSLFCARFNSSLNRLNRLLLEMPRDQNQADVLKKQRVKIKEKGQKYAPGTVTLQVLGSGAKGAPRSLYLFTDQSRYLFNCGEGTQRLAHEHKMKLSKLEHIFVTHPSWENMGGLPGVALTIQDVGVPEIMLHGPQGIDDIFTATRRFVVLKNLSVNMAQCDSGACYEDNVIQIQYVPLRSVENDSPHRSDSSSQRLGSSPEPEPSDDDTDYYAYEHIRNPTANNKRKRGNSSSGGQGCNELNKCARKSVEAVSMSYICRLRPRPGTLCLERCVAHGVPPGPLLGQLKAGLDVVLDNGKVVKSSDVTLPQEPSPLFIVVECPTIDYLPALIKETAFVKHQAQGKDQEDIAFLVVHFTPTDIIYHPEYMEWMDKFSPSTNHILINESNDCMGSVAVHRIQYKLNLLEPNFFPLLCNEGFTIVKRQSEQETVNNNGNATENGSTISTTLENKGLSAVSNNTFSELSKKFLIFPGHTFFNVNLRPKKALNGSSKLELDPQAYLDEVNNVDGFKEELQILKEKLLNFNGVDSDFPKITFLGTGSCIPNKTRNTSSMLLNISEDCNILMDCGEGTYGQLCRYYGSHNVDEVISKVKAVYISHLHADHHIGLVGLLKERNKVTSQPLFLFAPKQIMTWLNMYNKHFEKILSCVKLVPNGELLFDECTLDENMKSLISETLGITVHTTNVKHCPNAFGVAITHNTGWKITYSGDTRPCDSLVNLGMNSDLLIHEATMEDELADEAKFKLHSTTSQAIDIGRKMAAKFTMLTHFSQRYAKLPRLNESFTKDVGIAFDNMQVRLCDLPKLQFLYPALKLMFQEECEELEQKAFRRQLKLEKEQRQNFTR